MQSFRKRIAIQKQHKEPEVRYDPFKFIRKDFYSETKTFLKKAILMHTRVAASFEPLSDEEKTCRDEILKYTIDLEMLEFGTHEERKEVMRKYGRCYS